MLRHSIYGLILLTSFFTACDKGQKATPVSEVHMKYSGEQQALVVEDVQGQWSNGTASLIAEGFDHEQLKLYLTDITQPGDIKDLSEKNISFSDGLDFASTKLLDGTLTITKVDGEKVSGTFVISLLDDVGGVEARTIEGDFTVRTN